MWTVPVSPETPSGPFSPRAPWRRTLARTLARHLGGSVPGPGLGACSPGSWGEGPPAITFTELPGFRVGTQVRRERSREVQKQPIRGLSCQGEGAWRRPGAQPSEVRVPACVRPSHDNAHG